MQAEQEGMDGITAQPAVAQHPRGNVAGARIGSVSRFGASEHPAPYPTQLPQWLIQFFCPPGGTVLDPFNGSGTTGLAAQKTGRRYIGIDVNAEYLDLSLRTRLCQQTLDLDDAG